MDAYKIALPAPPTRSLFRPYGQTLVGDNAVLIPKIFPRLAVLAQENLSFDQTEFLVDGGEELPLKLMRRMKMSNAADLLSSGELLIKQVAEEVGFTDDGMPDTLSLRRT